MGVAPFSLLVGPARCYLAPVGTAFPDIDDDHAAIIATAWDDLGRTDGETRLAFEQNVNPIYVDQTTGAIKAVRTQEGVTVAMNLVDLTLERLGQILNANAVSTTVGPPNHKRLPLFMGVQVNQWALLVRQDSAYNAEFGQVELPVVIQTEAPGLAYTRADKSALSCKFMSLEDPDAAAGEEFGHYRMDST